MSKNLSTQTASKPDVLLIEKILTDRLKFALNKKAYLEIKPNPSGLFNVTINPCLPGPTNKNYFYYLLGKILKNLKDAIPVSSLKSASDSKRLAVGIETQDNNHYTIVVANLTKSQLTDKQDKNSLLNCIEKLAKQEKNSASLNVNQSRSEKIYQSLSKLPFFNAKYPQWQIKKKGCVPGVILRGKNKLQQEKTVFVKKVTLFHNEFLNPFIFEIANHCGIQTPQSKLKTINNDIFQFSHGLSNYKKKYSNKIYKYADLNIYFKDPDCYLDAKNFALNRGRKENGTFSETIVFDKISIARFFIACVIFAVNDHHPDNIGIIVSQKPQAAMKAKLAMVDCGTAYTELNAKYHNVLYQQKTFSDSVNCFINHFSPLESSDYLKVYSLHEFYRDLATQLDEKDYLEAFIKLEKNWSTAYSAQSKLALGLLEQPNEHEDAIEQIKLYQNSIIQWQQNFAMLKKIFLTANASPDNHLNFGR